MFCGQVRYASVVVLEKSLPPSPPPQPASNKLTANPDINRYIKKPYSVKLK